MNARFIKLALSCAAAVAVLALLSQKFWRTRPASVREASAQELTQRDGRMYFGNEPEPFTGVLVERYPSGELKSRSALAQGVLHGVSEGWHTNGVPQIREHFRKGVSHGLRTKWFADGQKLSEARIENGQITGTFRRWHENGAIAEEVSMSNGQPDGISRAFYPGGALKAQARLEKGKVVEQQFWKENEAPVVAAVRPAK